jgi:hypothetical protein
MSSQSEQGRDKPRVVRRVASAIDGAVHVTVDAIEEAADAAIDATARRWGERPGARVRAVRRRAKRPLPMLYAEHPEARMATPRELGLQTIDVADVVGTAVGGAGQRGGDFLPLKPFRSNNWRARWQRLRSAADRLVALPSIDVVRFGGKYWVLDGHNRVASGLYDGQLAIDANVTDLRLPGQARSEPAASLAAQLEDHMDLRAALTRSSSVPDPLPADPADPADPGDPATTDAADAAEPDEDR